MIAAVKAESERERADLPRRRTAQGESLAEERIGRDLELIAEAVRETLGSRLRALLLVGGYARGEGGVVGGQGELGPYNDYDLIAVVGGGPGVSVRRPLLDLGRRLTQDLSIDVDLWPIREADLGEVPATLFWLDVVLGGVEVLVGDEAVLGRLPALRARDVSHTEAARLLSNRAVGIALSNLEAEDRDLRRARHGHKAVLACGDARLLAADRYRPTVRERVAELERLRASPALGDEFAHAYADAAAFRVRPDHWSPPGDETLAQWSHRITALVGASHLSYEGQRVGTPTSPAGYANHRRRLFHGAPDIGETPAAALWAWARGRTPLSPWVGHPRERLARAAVALAYGHEQSGTRAVAARLLGFRDQGSTPTDEALHAALLCLAEVAG